MWKLWHALSLGTLYDPEREIISISRIYVGSLLIFLWAVSSVAHAAELKGSAKHCIVPPDFTVSDGQGLAPELKRFLGFFNGAWGDSGQLAHTLWVANITSDRNAVVYYAIEAYAPWNIYNPSCNRHIGTIKDKVLTLNFRNGAVVKYWLLDADTLRGTYDRRNRVTAGQFKRHN